MDIEFHPKLKLENKFLNLKNGDVFEYKKNIYMKIFDNIIGEYTCLCLFDNYKNLSVFTCDFANFDNDDEIKRIDAKLLFYK